MRNRSLRSGSLALAASVLAGVGTPATPAAALAGAGAGATTGAGETLRALPWQTAPAGSRLESPAAGPARLVVEHREPRPLTLPLLVIDAPGITGPRYALHGEVRHDGVEGQGYLEMWSHFPDGSRYFSRTLAAAGPLAALTGSAGPRAFVLPFFLDDAPARPIRLEVNLVLPGPGRVELGPLELRQYARGEDPLGGAGGFSGWRIGQLGGGLGALLGLLGGAIGLLGSTGRAPRLARALAAGGATLGGLLLAAGLVAFGLRQPSEAVFTLLLSGAIALPVFAGALRILRQRDRETELRRMQALDTR